MDNTHSKAHALDEAFGMINASIQEKEIFKKFQKLNNESLYHKATLLKEVINGFSKFADMLEQSPSIHLVEQLEIQLAQVINNLSTQHFKNITYSTRQTLMTVSDENLTNQKVDVTPDLLKTENSTTDVMEGELQAIRKACTDIQRQLQTVSAPPTSGFAMFPPFSTAETLNQPKTNSPYTILNAR